MSKLRQLKKYPIMVLFFAFLLFFLIADMVTPDQAVSEFENRTLQQNPTFNLDKLVNNEWTREYGEYIRDQFIFRDGWVSMYGALEMVQGKLEDGGVWFASDGYLIAKNDTWSDTQAVRLPANTGYIAELAQRYPGQVRAMIVPSPANILSGRLAQTWQPYQIDENGMMDDMFHQMADAGVGVIDLRGAFGEADAAGRQVYYRTDHHWTTDGGARIAYQVYCAAVGRAFLPPDEALRVDVDGFYGTNYSKTKRPGVQPDTLTYYDLPNTMTVEKLESDGSTAEFVTYHDQPLMDYEKLAPMDKYAAFMQGNNGYSSIAGNGEGRVVVFKDSYGNSFVPYLVANYAQVDVVDMRSWNFEAQSSVTGFIEAGGYDDILVLYSFAAFSDETMIRMLLS